MDLIIVGAGGMGREVFTWLTHDIQNKPGYRIKGFLDKNPHALDNYSYPVKIIGDDESYEPQQNDAFVLAIAYPNVKQKVTENLLQKKANFYTLIHPTAIIGINSKIGTGSIICPHCVITNDAIIGDFVILNSCVTVGHDVVIGDYCLVLGKSEIAGTVTIGSSTLIGAGATIIQNCKIGEQSTIGAGGVVIRDIPENCTAVGVPAKIIKTQI